MTDVTTMSPTEHQKQRDMIRALREIIRRAILTFKALPDPDAKFLRQGRAWDVIHDANQAYGYAEASVRDFQPTPHEIDQAMVVLTWLAWLSQREGRESVKRITAWAMGVPVWRLGQKERVSEKTISRRIDRSICAIMNELLGDDYKLEVVEEPHKATSFAMSWVPNETWDQAFGSTTDGHQVRIQTVYVYGKGLMRNGRRWDDGRGKAEGLSG